MELFIRFSEDYGAYLSNIEKLHQTLSNIEKIDRKRENLSAPNRTTMPKKLQH